MSSRSPWSVIFSVHIHSKGYLVVPVKEDKRREVRAPSFIYLNKMKNFYSLVVLLATTLCVSAQNVVMHHGIETIPSYFTYNHTPYIVDRCEEGENNIIDLYDMNFNKISSFNIDTDVYDLNLRSVIDKNGICHSPKEDELYLTQTFFNDDADWEYVVRDEGEDVNEWGYAETVSYTIKKTDGTVVGSIPVGKLCQLLVINDVVYAVIHDYDESTDEYTVYYYTVPEYRKILFNDKNGVKPVPSMVHTVSSESYDLMGRKVSNGHNGVVITEGTKSLLK